MTRAVVWLSLLLAACATQPLQSPEEAEARRQSLRTAERGFAQSMVDRDREAFAQFLAEDAVFNGSGQPLRGKAAILAHWSRFFEGPEAPFSWSPSLSEVDASGQLGYSEGPVLRPDGQRIGSFHSTWRWQQGRWQVLFDSGSAWCPR